jgi:hypothetical protein
MDKPHTLLRIAFRRVRKLERSYATASTDFLDFFLTDSKSVNVTVSRRVFAESYTSKAEVVGIGSSEQLLENLEEEEAQGVGDG